MIRTVTCLWLITGFCGGAFCAGYRAGFAAEGNYEMSLFDAKYTGGISPEIFLTLGEGRDLTFAVPLACRGVLYERTGYRQHTVYFSAGLGVAYLKRILACKALTIAWGPELFFSYGFRPVTYLNVGGERSTIHHNTYLIGSAGAAWLVCGEFAVKKWLGIRLTERFVRLMADSRFDEGYSSELKVEAGLKPFFSPVVALVAKF